MSERWVDADSYEAGFADAGYPPSWEAHLRRRVKELERENARLRSKAQQVVYGIDYALEHETPWIALEELKEELQEFVHAQDFP